MGAKPGLPPGALPSARLGDPLSPRGAKQSNRLLQGLLPPPLPRPAQPLSSASHGPRGCVSSPTPSVPPWNGLAFPVDSDPEYLPHQPASSYKDPPALRPSARTHLFSLRPCTHARTSIWFFPQDGTRTPERTFWPIHLPPMTNLTLANTGATSKMENPS